MGSLQTSSNDEKPHAICVPFPAQGHITPMLKLAKILHSKGFHITFVNNEYNRNRFLRSFGSNALYGLQSFRFEAIPDGLPPTEGDKTQDIPSLCHSTERLGLGPLKELVTRINEDPSVPRVSCIVSDAIMFFTLDAAEEFGVPVVFFWTASVCSLLGCAQYKKLVDKKIVPFKVAQVTLLVAVGVVPMHGRPLLWGLQSVSSPPIFEMFAMLVAFAASVCELPPVVWLGGGRFEVGAECPATKANLGSVDMVTVSPRVPVW